MRSSSRQRGSNPIDLQVITDPWFWAVAIPAVALAGVAKGGLGGAGPLATPLIALVVPPPQAAAIMLVLLCVMDLFGVRAYLKYWDKAIMRVILPAGILGCVIGGLTFRHMNESWIRILIGLIVLWFLAFSLLPRKGVPRRPAKVAGWFWAAMSGFTSFVAHAGSPPLLVWLLPQKLEKTSFMATLLVFFAAINYVKIGPYVWLGLLDLRNLATSLALVPLGVGCIYLGIWLTKRIDTRLYYRIMYGLLFITGAKLLYDGISGL